MNNKILKYIFSGALLVVLMFGLSGCSQTESFQKPDIKNSFCGVVMSARYCRCAFHDEYCDSVGLSKGTASYYVHSEYNKWVKYRQEKFKENCLENNGIYRSGECEYCEAGFAKEGNRCVEVEPGEESEDDKGFVADGPIDNDCNIKGEEFKKDWRKYSDFDNRIPAESRSWETQNALPIQDIILQLRVENFELVRDMEIDRQIRIEAKEFRRLIARNQLQNLIKVFTRMTYLTYTTIKSGSGAGRSLDKFLTSSKGLEQVGGLLNAVKAVVPNDASIAINTASSTGKAINIGLSTILSAVENMGNPTEIAKTFMTESRNAVMPSASLDKAEIAILRDHFIVKQHVDFAIKESYVENGKRRKQLIRNKKIIASLQAEFVVWEEAEKARVRSIIEQSCLEAKKKYEKE